MPYQELGRKVQETDTFVFSFFSNLNQEDREIVAGVGINRVLNLIERKNYDGWIGENRWQKSENPFEKLNNQVTDLVKGELDNYKNAIIINFSSVLKKEEEKTNSAIKCLTGAKVSSLMAVINQSNDIKTAIEYGIQSINYLRDLGIGFHKSEKIGNDFYQKVSNFLI